MFWIALAVVLIVLVVLIAVKQKPSHNGESGTHYNRTPALFTPAERSFLGVLDLAAGNDFRVFGKVRVGDVLSPRAGQDRSTRQTALNRINRKHFDFILCRPDDLTVLCAIELNDASHQRKDRQERDEFLTKTCRSAGLPLIPLDARHAYSPTEISTRIAEAMAGGIPVRPEPAPQPVPQEDDSVPENEIAPLCPRCSGTMVKRVAKGGENAGKEFWGCTNFPKCREIVTIYFRS